MQCAALFGSRLLSLPPHAESMLAAAGCRGQHGAPAKADADQCRRRLRGCAIIGSSKDSCDGNEAPGLSGCFTLERISFSRASRGASGEQPLAISCTSRASSRYSLPSGYQL